MCAAFRTYYGPAAPVYDIQAQFRTLRVHAPIGSPDAACDIRCQISEHHPPEMSISPSSREMRTSRLGRTRQSGRAVVPEMSIAGRHDFAERVRQALCSAAGHTKANRYRSCSGPQSPVLWYWRRHAGLHHAVDYRGTSRCHSLRGLHPAEVGGDGSCDGRQQDASRWHGGEGGWRQEVCRHVHNHHGRCQVVHLHGRRIRHGRKRRRLTGQSAALMCMKRGFVQRVPAQSGTLAGTCLQSKNTTAHGIRARSPIGLLTMPTGG